MHPERFLEHGRCVVITHVLKEFAVGMRKCIPRDFGAWKMCYSGGECLDVLGKHWQTTLVLAALGEPLATCSPGTENVAVLN